MLSVQASQALPLEPSSEEWQAKKQPSSSAELPPCNVERESVAGHNFCRRPRSHPGYQSQQLLQQRVMLRTAFVWKLSLSAAQISINLGRTRFYMVLPSPLAAQACSSESGP